MICRTLCSHRTNVEKFRSSLFKGLQGLGAAPRVALRRERNSQSFEKGRNGEFSCLCADKKRGEPTRPEGFSCVGANDSYFAVTHYPLFSLTLRAQRKDRYFVSTKKETHIKEFRPLRRSTWGAAPRPCKPLKRFDLNFFAVGGANIVPDKLQFIARTILPTL